MEMMRHTARLAALALMACLAQPASAGDLVTDWTLAADRLGRGGANWRTLAIMQRAMHDAVNAAQPTYARWHPAEPDEPAVDPALSHREVANAALSAAAARVLTLLHPEGRDEVDRTYARAQARTPDGPAEDAGTALGRAIAEAAVRRRAKDGFSSKRLFPTSAERGKWSPVPQEFLNSSTTDTKPFLFTSADEVPAVPPPAINSPQFQRELKEVRKIGGLESSVRTDLQTEAASYWYFQSSQRGFLYLGMAMLELHPPKGGMAAEARIMSQLASALADSAVLTWWEKEHFLFWRPIVAIRGGIEGVEPDPDWMPMIETPPHPEYPSGHAADCFTGAFMLQAAFPGVTGPISYVAQPGRPPSDVAMNMGQHSMLADSGIRAKRTYPSLAAMAEDCSDSRIWAGAHFRAADEEARRLGHLIAKRAIAAVP